MGLRGSTHAGSSMLRALVVALGGFWVSDAYTNLVQALTFAIILAANEVQARLGFQQCNAGPVASTRRVKAVGVAGKANVGGNEAEVGSITCGAATLDHMFPSHLIRHEGEVAVATGGGRVRGVGGAVQVLGQLHLNTTAAKTFATEAGEAQGIEVRFAWPLPRL